MADPAPVAQTFFMDPSIEQACKLDAIVTVVDAKHIIQHLDEEKPEGADSAWKTNLDLPGSRRRRRRDAVTPSS